MRKNSFVNSVPVQAVYRKETIMDFYGHCIGISFAALSPERIVELDESIKKWSYQFNKAAQGFKNKLTFVAEKMLISNGIYGPVTWEEKMYFFVKMVDPELKYLQYSNIYENEEELKDFYKKQYGICDMNLLRLERSFSRRFMQGPEVQKNSRIN